MSQQRPDTRPAPFVTLLTDYGWADEFVGVCHGVIAQICPQARVIDLSHGVPRQDVRAGAALLHSALPYLPVGVHVAVVDPTVGAQRRAVALELADGRLLVGPDNGLLWPAAAAAGGVVQAVEISDSPWCLRPISATFHGRDIFAPVAARLAAGEPLAQAGAALDPRLLVRLEFPPARLEGGTLVAVARAVDHFGNVTLAAGREDLPVGAGAVADVLLPGGRRVRLRVGRTFDDVAAGEALLYEDASRSLALAVNHGSAAADLELSLGQELRITPADA